MMIEYTDKIKEVAKKLLDEGRVDCFIGYKKGSIPMCNQPVIITKSESAEMLFWDSNSAMNLSNYLPKRTDKIGILATGCNSRNIALHIFEKQISRDQLYIVGVPCKGMLDHRAVSRAVDGREILSVDEKDGEVLVKCEGFEKTLKIADFLQTNCQTCTNPNPVIYDELIADEVAKPDIKDEYADVKEIETMSSDERWQHFEDTFASCIRCYACRNACPLCYCPTCFVDESKPQWLGKSIDKNDTLTFHFLRAYHMAGRCTECGACERACPVDIPLRYLTKKLNKDAKEIYGYESGLDATEKTLFDVYNFKDLNDFIR